MLIGEIALYLYLIATGVVYLCCGIYCQQWTSDAATLSTYPTGFMN